MENIYITASEEMPMRVHGCVAMDAEGDYIVAINARLTPELQKEALEHELEHIRRGDLAQRHQTSAHVIEADIRKKVP